MIPPRATRRNGNREPPTRPLSPAKLEKEGIVLAANLEVAVLDLPVGQVGDLLLELLARSATGKSDEGWGLGTRFRAINNCCTNTVKGPTPCQTNGNTPAQRRCHFLHSRLATTDALRRKWGLRHSNEPLIGLATAPSASSRRTNARTSTPQSWTRSHPRLAIRFMQ